MNYNEKTESERTRARRVQSLRKMTRLSRRTFAKRYGIAPGTLQNWEDIHGNGLTEKGAKRLIKVLQTSGIYCSFEWLMHGIGAGPRVDESLYLDKKLVCADTPTQIVREQQLIAAELALFYQHYKETIDCIITDDGMFPQFKKGDHVAGIRRYGNQIKELLGQDCIVMTAEGDLLVRELRQSELPNHYTLACTNTRAAVTKPMIYDIEIISAAPVIWLRRPQGSQTP